MSSNTESVDIDELISNIREDPDLKPEEKQFIVSGTKADDEVQVYTEIASMMRRLLAHPEFIRQDLRDLNGDRLSPEEYHGEPVTGVRGRLPVGCLKVRASSRSTATHADIVSRWNYQKKDGDTVSVQEHQVDTESEVDDD